MKDNALITLSKQFAIDIINLCGEIKKRSGNLLCDQLLRAGTSIGANIHEGNYASSRADFINKFRIALKECYETEYWMDIFKEAGWIKELEHKEYKAKCNKLRILLITSIKTADSAEHKK